MIRIALTQPDIRPYRVPAYNLLALQPDIELHVFADQPSDAPSFDPEEVAFHYHHSPVERRRIGPATFFHQPAQVDVVDPSRFDLLIHTWNIRYRTLPTALKKAKRLAVPTVLRGHGYSKNDSWLRTRLRNKLGHRAAGIMLYSHPVAKRMIDQFGFDPQRVFVSQNALDQTPIHAARNDWLARPGDLASFQAEHQLNPERTLSFVSRLYEQNGIDQLICAVAELQQEFPGTTAVIIGEGDQREPLESLAGELGIAEHVRFVGPIYCEHDLAPWMMSSAVYCHPEYLGLSLLTAQGFGLPAVTSDNDAVHGPEVVALKPEQNGLRFRHRDPSSLTSCLGRLLRDETLRQRMANEALRTVQGEFSLAGMVQGYIDATQIVDGVSRKVVER